MCPLSLFGSCVPVPDWALCVLGPWLGRVIQSLIGPYVSLVPGWVVCPRSLVGSCVSPVTGLGHVFPVLGWVVCPWSLVGSRVSSVLGEVECAKAPWLGRVCQRSLVRSRVYSVTCCGL